MRNGGPPRWQPRGVVLDLDGTLLDRDESISGRVADMLRGLSARIPVAIASGREPADVRRFALDLRMTAPQISDNGARILDPQTGHTLEEQTLAPEDAQHVVAMLAERGMRFFAVDDGRMVQAVEEFGEWRVTVIAGHTGTEEVSLQVQSSVAERHGVAAVPARDADGVKWYVNFTNAGANKGAGLRRWSLRTGTSLEGVLFVGDSYNDLHAFEAAGLPVAMGSAPDEVKRAAQHTVSDVYSDGVAEAVERFVLPYLS
ncbi:MAG: HAD family hydrolase [Chloroflexota bacterium]